MSEPKVLAGPGARPNQPPAPQRPGAAPPAHPTPHPPWWGVLIARMVAGDPEHQLTKSEQLAYKSGRALGFRWGAAYGLAIGMALTLVIGFAAVSSQGLAVQWAYERGRGQEERQGAPLVVPAPADRTRDALPRDGGYDTNPVNGRRLAPPAEAP